MECTAYEDQLKALIKKRKALLKNIRNSDGNLIVSYLEAPSCRAFRPDVTVHGYLRDPSPETERFVRRWLEQRGLQYSRNIRELHKDIHRLRIYIGEIIPVQVEVGYHATRRANLGSILDVGLEPSVPIRQTSEGRLDCEGNIYVCKALGIPEDAGQVRSFSAPWWRAALAKANESDVADWVILEVDLRELGGMKAIRDMWSESGVIITGVERIPADRLRLVYP